jgi:predicted HTH transcriptional regulator
MSSFADLQKTKDALTALDAEIADQRARFEASIVELLEQRNRLEAELAAGLRAELATLGGAGRGSDGRGARPRGRRSKIDEEKIVAALRRHSPLGAQYIADQLEATANGISSAALSNKLRDMVERGLLVREGERRGTKYSVGPRA